MHRALLLWVLASLLVPFCARAEGPAPEPAEWRLADNLLVRELAPDTYLVDHRFPWSSNSLVRRFADGSYLLLDTPGNEAATRLLLAWIDQREGHRPVLAAINTHFHIDRLGGNAVLRAAGIPVYGSDLTVRLLKERGLGHGMLDLLPDEANRPLREAYQAVSLQPPDHVFPIAEGLRLSFAGESVEVFFPGGGHTEDNVVVYLPAQKLLFGACLIKSLESRSRGFVGDADTVHWAASLDTLSGKYPDAQLVVPGHGAPGDRSLIDHTRRLVTAK